MQIKITSLKQDLHTFDVADDEKIISLKEKLACIISVDPSVINIISLGKILVDDSTIASNKITDNSKLVYMIKKKPIAKPVKEEEPVVFSERIESMQKSEPEAEVNLFDAADKHDEYKARLMPQIYESFIRILNNNKDVIINDLNEERDKYNQIEKNVFDNIINNDNFINEIVKFGGASSFITQNQPPMMNMLFDGGNGNQFENMLMNMLARGGGMPMRDNMQDEDDEEDVEENEGENGGDHYRALPQRVNNEFTPQNLADIAELEALCGDKDKAIRFYLMSGKNKVAAAEILFEDGFADF
jgi:hypothetical protein